MWPMSSSKPTATQIECALSNTKLHAPNMPLSTPGSKLADPGYGTLTTFVEKMPAHSESAPPSLPNSLPPKRTTPRASVCAASSSPPSTSNDDDAKRDGR